MESIKTKRLVDIFFIVDEDLHEGLKVLFQFDSGYLYFDLVRFYVSDDDSIYRSQTWKSVNYNELTKNVSIVNIREHELTSYFVEFSNGDIFFIKQCIDSTEFWFNDFEIVKKNDTKRYIEVKEYMDEDFVEDVELSA